MDILDSAPSLPDWNQQTQDALAATRTPSMGEFLGASVREGWWNTTTAAMQAVVGVGQAEHQDSTRIPQHEWNYSVYRRDGIRWDEGMTVGRARAQAETFDENRYRRSLMEARDAGLFETVLSYGGMLLGSAGDMVNFVPIAAPASRGLRAAGMAAEGAAGSRAALAAASVLERPGVAGSALRGAVDAVGGNAAAAPVVYGVQSQFGDEVTFQRVVTDLALGAVIGTGFGTAAGLLARQTGPVRPSEMAAVRTLDAAAQDVARTGEVQTAAPAMAVRMVEEAVLRAAPEEVRAFMPPDARLSDLPVRPDGEPLSRAEFDARVTEAVEAAAPAVEARAASMPAPDAAAARLDTAAAPVEQQALPLDAPRAVPDAAAAPAATPATAASPPAPRINTDAAFAWYREAVAAKTQTERLSALPPTQQPGAQAAAAPRAAGAEGETTRAMDSADTDMGDLPQQIEALRAEGRVSPGDDATIKAAAETAKDLEGAAKGLEEAAACIARRLA